MGQAISKGITTVASDQVQYQASFWEHPKTMVAPTILGVVLIVASIIVLSVTGECHTVDEKTKEQECTGQNVGLFAGLLVTGIVLISAVSIYRAILNPRAAGEQMVANEALQFFSSSS